jgi:hypothetical protein
MFGLRNGPGDSRVSTSKSSGKSGSRNVARQKRSRERMWMCEALELRRLFATVSWVLQGSGDWSVGANWSTGTVPQAGDDVVIDVPGVNLTVTYTAAAVLPLGNLINTEVLDIEGAAGATWNGGTWDGSGVVQIGTSLAIGGSADKIIKDGLELDNLGTTTLDGTGNIVGVVGASITNEVGATFDVESDADITFPAGVGTGIFENGGEFIKSGGGTAPGDQTEIGGAQGFTFENSINDVTAPQYSIPGDCQVSQGTLTLGDNQNVALTEGGTFEISAGATLNFDRGAANIVVLRPPNGAPNVIPSITGEGELEVSGGSVQFYGTLAVHLVYVNAGSLLLQQNMQETAGTPQKNTTPNLTPYGKTDQLVITGGTFGGNGGGIFTVPAPIDHEEEPALVVADTFEWLSGTISGAGRLVIDATVATGQSVISTTAPKAIVGGFGIDILNETIMQDSGTITMDGASAIYIHQGGTLWDQGNETIVGGTVDNLGGNVWNTGIFLKLNGTGITSLGAGIDFINDENPLDFVTASIPIIQYPDPGNPSETFAKLDIRTGTVSLAGTSLNRNTYLIHPGATLSFDGGNHLNQTYVNSNNVINASILGVSNGGSINFGAANFNSDAASLVDVPTATFGTGSYSFNDLAQGAQRILTGTFTGGATGTITGNGTLEVVNAFQWNSGQFVGTGGTTSSLLIDPGAVLTLATGNYLTSNGYSVDNNGTILWATSPGTLTVGGNFNQSATGVFDSVIVNGVPDALSVSGTVTIAGTLNLSIASFTPSNGEVLTLIDNTGAGPISGQFVGYTEGLIFNLDGDIFKISYVGGTGNDLTLTSIVFPNLTIATPRVFVRALTGITDLVFTVTSSATFTTDVSVHYASSNGTAVAGVDYVATSGTLVIPAGQTTGTITVPIIGTSAVRPALNFTMTLSNPVDANLGNPFSAVATLVSVNGPPVLSFFNTAYVIDENAGFATIVVSTSNPAIASQVSYTTTDGSAIAGVAYTATSGVLNFAVGVSQLTFNVPIIDQGLTSGQQEFTVALSNPTLNGATLGSASQAAVEILDNDGVTPVMSISNATVTEPISGQSTAVFDLSLSVPSALPISVQYATANGTATEGKYVAQAGTLNFTPGQTTAQISVVVNSDFVQTTTETFTVNLSNPVNVTLGNTSATGTILSQTVTTVPIVQGHPFRYVDAFGARAAISLVGPGSGTVTYLGPTTADAKQIVLTGTTIGSTLSIGTSRGLTGVTNIIVNGSLKAINAPGVLVIGEVNVTGGVQTVRLNSLLAESSVTLGTDPGIGITNATFNAITNANITSATPLGTLHVNTWENTAGGTGLIAPSVKAFSATQNVQANISLNGNLTSMVVRGTLNGSVISVGGNIGSFTVGTISNTDILAGVSPGVLTLPTSSTQFTDTGSTISRFTVTSRRPAAFSNTIIAAPIVGIVQLGSALVANSGTTFGIAGTSINSVRGKGTNAIKQTEASLSVSPFSDMDLLIHLV